MALQKLFTVFSQRKCVDKHKENRFSINGKQSVKLEKGIITFENYFKQIPTYADFECNLKSVECDEGSYTKKYQDHIPCSFAYKVLIIGLLSQLLFIEVKMMLMTLLKQFLKSIKTAKQIMNKHFNKYLIISEEEEHLCQQSNICWICKKTF